MIDNPTGVALVQQSFDNWTLAGPHAVPTSGVDIIFNEPAPGDPLLVGDDGFYEPSIGFPFEVCGTDHDSVFVNANGSLTFGSGDTDFSESVGELLTDQPRIAPLWDDLSPNSGGLVPFESESDNATVIFYSVPEFIATGANTFMVTLRDDGGFTIECGAVSAADGLAGTTEGGGAADPGETDLSGRRPFQAAGTTHENFMVDDNDLDGATVDFDP